MGHEETLRSLNSAPGVKVSPVKVNFQNTGHDSGSTPTLVAIPRHSVLVPSVILSFHLPGLGGGGRCGIPSVTAGRVS